MENSKGTVSHFTGIIRMVAFVVLIAIIAFFAIRWIRAGQEVGRSQQDVSSEEQAVEGEESEATEESEEERVIAGVEDSNPVGTEEEREGSQTAPSVTSEIPQVGAENALPLVFSISGLVYVAARYRASRSQLQRYK